MWELLQNTQEDQSNFICERFWQLANTFLSVKFMVINVSAMALAGIIASISKLLVPNNYS